MYYYQFNIGDYRSDTFHLSRIEHSIYRDLIDWYYLDELPIPLGSQSVTRRLRLVSEEDVKSLENVLNDFFIKQSDGWHHTRIDAEISDYHKQCDKNKLNGIKGGRPKNNPLGSQSEPSGNPNQEPRTKNHKPITNNQVLKNSLSSELDSRLVNEIFEFWKIELDHPNSRIDKKRSKAIFGRLKEGYTVERIKEAIRGIKLCPHNMGQNERGQVYDDIELICRSGANVDRFADAEFKRPMDKLTKRMADCLLPITDGSDKL